MAIIDEQNIFAAEKLTPDQKAKADLSFSQGQSSSRPSSASFIDVFDEKRTYVYSDETSEMINLYNIFVNPTGKGVLQKAGDELLGGAKVDFKTFFAWADTVGSAVPIPNETEFRKYTESAAVDPSAKPTSTRLNPRAGG